MPRDLPERVKQYVSEFCCEPIERLTEQARLEEDLGMTGDDADEFLAEFAKRFEIDLTGLEFHKHFGPEGCNPLWLFYTPAWLKEHGKYPVTIGHLIRVAEVRRWFSPPRTGR